MKTIRQLNLKNRQGYFFSYMANIKDFDLSLLNVDQIDFKDDDVFFIYDINGTLTKGSGAASKDQLDAVENKIPNVSGFLLTGVFNSKITEVENKIPDIENLARKTE